MVGGNGGIFAAPDGGNPPRRHARGAQDIGHGKGTALRQVLVVGGFAHIVGVADHFDGGVGVADKAGCHGAQVIGQIARERGAVGGKQEVLRHVHHKIAAHIGDRDIGVERAAQFGRLTVKVRADGGTGGGTHGPAEKRARQFIAVTGHRDTGHGAQHPADDRTVLGAGVRVFGIGVGVHAGGQGQRAKGGENQRGLQGHGHASSSRLRRLPPWPVYSRAGRAIP